MACGSVLRVKSQNFEFLRAKRPVLADLTFFAESYAYPDPAGSLVKQRGFAEQVVTAIYDAYGLVEPRGDHFAHRINHEPFLEAVPEVVVLKLHAVRKAGNEGAHPRGTIQQGLVLDSLYQVFEIAKWVHLQLDGGSAGDFKEYVDPPREPPDRARAREALERLRLADERYEKTVAALEEERKKRLEAEQAVEQSAEQLAALKTKGKQVANVLRFNEETTRHRLIDRMLVDAGWDVGLNGKQTEQVHQEVPVTTMPTASGAGYIDYVLYGDDGKPLAVVEAKRTAKDPKIGAEQARIYAECLEREAGQRPVIFYTNGLDLWIWDDAQGYPARKVVGFYSKDSLEYLIRQRAAKVPLDAIEPNLAIADRIYQLEAVRAICDRFTQKERKALLVLATGTGKTRVAISLCDVLLRAGWAKRILFLCDRRELRKQADNVFKDYLPGEPRVIIDSTTSSDRNKRIYLATYPAMMKCYEEFDVGFFDLIIADESHRSIYNKYRPLFRYFDALQVGLTATPIRLIDRNTFDLFDCKGGEPVAQFGYLDAIGSSPPYLVPFRVREVSSEFREKGIKYRELSAGQREELEEREEAPETVDHEAHELDRSVFNKGSTRIILQTLMEEGIRNETGSHVGKTIIFAVSHKHALHLAEVFDELYPQYGGTFCRVIDNQIVRAEQLIDDFKARDGEPFVAISVDMLDTGIDVPEIVNLVFAKRVLSPVKFWQMIGRGTRLCRNLFGPGRDKTEFLIFDHWWNFWRFDEEYQEKQPRPQKSLLQRLFEARIAVAEAAIEAMDEPALQVTVDLLLQDLHATRETRSIEVRERLPELERLSDRDRIEQLAAATRADLLSIAAPLMQWRNIRGDEDAYRFDLLITTLEEAVLRGSPRVADLRARVEAAVELLMKNQGPVKAKAASIQTVRSKAFWASVTVPQLEQLRADLRGVMKYQQPVKPNSVTHRILDITDIVNTNESYITKLEGLDRVQYKHRIEAVVKAHFSEHAVVQAIRAGKPVRDDQLEELARLVRELDDKADVQRLLEPDAEGKRALLPFFRSLVGLDATAVQAAFQGFLRNHTRLTAQQLQFLQLLWNHIAQNGGIEVERLYEPPFTTLHAESVDGLFPNEDAVDEIIAILEAFQVPTHEETS